MFGLLAGACLQAEEQVEAPAKPRITITLGPRLANVPAARRKTPTYCQKVTSTAACALPRFRAAWGGPGGGASVPVAVWVAVA